MMITQYKTSRARLKEEWRKALVNILTNEATLSQLQQYLRTEKEVLVDKLTLENEIKEALQKYKFGDSSYQVV